MDRVVTAIPLDTTGDGKVDSLIFDATGDGAAEGRVSYRLSVSSLSTTESTSCRGVAAASGPGVWVCSACTLENRADDGLCGACESPKPLHMVTAVAASTLLLSASCASSEALPVAQPAFAVAGMALALPVAAPVVSDTQLVAGTEIPAPGIGAPPVSLATVYSLD